MIAANTGKTILEIWQSLPPDQQQEALDYLEFLQYKRGHQRPRRKWREIMGAATEPLTGEDAQAWVSRTRQETTEHRATHPGAQR